MAEFLSWNLSSLLPPMVVPTLPHDLNTQYLHGRRTGTRDERGDEEQEVSVLTWFWLPL